MTNREAEWKILEMRRDFGKYTKEEEEALYMADLALTLLADLKEVLQDEGESEEK